MKNAIRVITSLIILLTATSISYATEEETPSTNIDITIGLDKGYYDRYIPGEEMILHWTIENVGETDFNLESYCGLNGAIYLYKDDSLILSPADASSGCELETINIKHGETYTQDTVLPYSLEEGSYKIQVNSVLADAEGYTYTVWFTCKEPPFSDIENHWAREYITGLYTMFYDSYNDQPAILGYNGSFLPDASITRAEFLKLVLRWPSYTTFTTETFKDVDSEEWYYEYVETGVSHGMFDTTSSDYFRPNEPITRAEAMEMWFNEGYFDYDTENVFYNTFYDVTDETQIPYIMTLYNMGIISGYENSQHKFGPDNLLTRGEAAKIIFNGYWWLTWSEWMDETTNNHNLIGTENNENIALKYYYNDEERNFHSEFLMCENGKTEISWNDNNETGNTTIYNLSKTSMELVVKHLYDYKMPISEVDSMENTEGLETGITYYFSGMASELYGTATENNEDFDNMIEEMKDIIKDQGEIISTSEYDETIIDELTFCNS